MAHDNLTAVLGIRLDELFVSSFFRSFNTGSKPRLIGDRFHLDLPSSGIAFIASLDGRVSSIQLYAGGYEGYRQFMGDLPGGVSFSDSREAVINRMGKPTASGGGDEIEFFGESLRWDRFDRQSYSLHLQYIKGGASVNLVSVLRPDAVPRE